MGFIFIGCSLTGEFKDAMPGLTLVKDPFCWKTMLSPPWSWFLRASKYSAKAYEAAISLTFSGLIE
jgi:hypothetical protein